MAHTRRCSTVLLMSKHKQKPKGTCARARKPRNYSRWTISRRQYDRSVPWLRKEISGTKQVIALKDVLLEAGKGMRLFPLTDQTPTSRAPSVGLCPKED